MATKLIIDGVEVLDSTITIITKTTTPPVTPPVNPPVEPPVAGTYTAILKSAIRLDREVNPGSGAYGYLMGSQTGQYYMITGATYWFLVDPKTVLGQIGPMRIEIWDYTQSERFYCEVHIINPRDNAMEVGPQTGVWNNPDTFMMTYGQGSFPSGPTMLDKKRWLVKIVPRDNIELSILWRKLW